MLTANRDGRGEWLANLTTKSGAGRIDTVYIIGLTLYVRQVDVGWGKTVRLEYPQGGRVGNSARCHQGAAILVVGPNDALAHWGMLK